MRAGLVAAAALLLVACSPASTRQASALMESPIAPASDAIFGAVIYTNGQLATAPRTDAEWDRLEQHAQSLVAAGASLKALAPTDDPAQWVRQSDALASASADALRAVKNRSLDGVLDAGSKIYDTCTLCHAAYVKDN